MAVKFERVAFGGWQDCVRLSNGVIELIATAAVGPRVLHFGFVGGQNFLRVEPEHAGLVGGDVWRSYGGHRLWHAPEAKPRTFWPDNEPVEVEWKDGALTLLQPIERTTGLVKRLTITMDPEAASVRMAHGLTNQNLWAIETAPWALTVLAQGGLAIVPQEPYRPHAEYLLPARPLVLWHYTDMADPRWHWGTRYVRLRQDPERPSYQKFGVRNAQGWGAYALQGELFLKRIPFDPAATYPDFGCNMEVFTNADFLELESLGPLAPIAPGAEVQHEETWELHRVAVGDTEAAIAAALDPLVGAVR